MKFLQALALLMVIVVLVVGTFLMIAAIDRVVTVLVDRSATATANARIEAYKRELPREIALELAKQKLRTDIEDQLKKLRDK